MTTRNMSAWFVAKDSHVQALSRYTTIVIRVKNVGPIFSKLKLDNIANVHSVQMCN